MLISCLLLEVNIVEDMGKCVHNGNLVIILVGQCICDHVLHPWNVGQVSAELTDRGKLVPLSVWNWISILKERTSEWLLVCKNV